MSEVVNPVDKFFGTVAAAVPTNDLVQNSEECKKESLKKFVDYIVDKVLVFETGVKTEAKEIKDIITAEAHHFNLGKDIESRIEIGASVICLPFAIRKKYPDVVITSQTWYNIRKADGYTMPANEVPDAIPTFTTENSVDETVARLLTMAVPGENIAKLLNDGQMAGTIKVTEVNGPTIPEVKSALNVNYDRCMNAAKKLGDFLLTLERDCNVSIGKVKIIIHSGAAAFETRMKKNEAGDAIVIKMADKNEAKKYKDIVYNGKEKQPSDTTVIKDKTKKKDKKKKDKDK